MIRRKQTVQRVTGTLCVIAGLLGLVASHAIAAPSLGVEVTRDAPTVARNDERVDYTVNVENTASPNPSVGQAISCKRGTWNVATTFTYQWIRNGVPLESAEDIAHGAQSETYLVQGVDAGKVLQCVVRGESPGGPGKPATEQVSLPPTVVQSVPAVAPPSGSGELLIEPLDAAVPGTVIECKAPSFIAGTGITWSFLWLRNGQDQGSAHVLEATPTLSKYEVQAGDSGNVIQCEAIASNDGGTSIVFSHRKPIEIASEPPGPVGGTPANIQFGSETTGQVTAEIELPGGGETYAYQVSGSGWSCETVPAAGAQSAKVICTRSDTLQPSASYPSIVVATALGADAPDVAVARATVYGGGAGSPATGTDEFTFAPATPFGLSLFEAGVFDSLGLNSTAAGEHPFSVVGEFILNKKRQLVPTNGGKYRGYLPVGHPKQVLTDLPRGQVGNALAIPELCASAGAVLENPTTCPGNSVVGGVTFFFNDTNSAVPFNFPIYAIRPEFGTPAQFAFKEVSGNLFTLSARLRPEDGYAVSLDLIGPPDLPLIEATATLCGFGGKKNINGNFAGCKQPGEPGANPKPLITNPTRCAGSPPTVRTRLSSWEEPGRFAESESTTPATTECDKVPFEPKAQLSPSSHQADSPTGLDIELSMPTDGLEDPNGISQANLKGARIEFPKGMAVNASAGQGLGSCSADQVGIHEQNGKLIPNNDPIACPDSSKVGTVEIETPILEETLKGDVYIAKQGAIEGSLIGLYLVFDSKKDGILVKVPTKVSANPTTGQLIAVVDNSPEAPFSKVRMHFPGGPSATLITPPKCGSYAIKAELTPWSAKDPNNPTPTETVTQTSSFNVTEGPNGGPCPNGGLDPKLSAGTTSPVAGKTSPFVLRLSREDGTDRFTALNLTTPPGLTAYLKGIPYCSDAILGSISSQEGTGQPQIDHPSCPAASQIGVASAGAGAGSSPLFVNTGKAYLSGPYKGAPLSLALVTPAVAGPLDLGNVVVRTALYLNPETAQITAVSDPIPTILHGILLDLRDVRVSINRPNFILNPTDCDPLSIGASVKGQSGASANLSNRFQVGGCESLAFKPKLSIELSGGTKRGGHPALKGVVQAKPGEANIDGAAVTIPRSEFLDQAHIRTICTRVQFAAKQCPEGSIYGHATATTPLLDYPVEGPVYLRSSDHKLPDLVVALHGPDYQPIEAVVVGRIDSVKGQIRNTFEAAPDVPITKFVLSMRGGKKGLLINSRDTCASRNRATVKLEGHNGMEFDTRPAVKNTKCGAGRKGRRGHTRHRHT